jgi:hypothetical protein
MGRPTGAACFRPACGPPPGAIGPGQGSTVTIVFAIALVAAVATARVFAFNLGPNIAVTPL